MWRLAAPFVAETAVGLVEVEGTRQQQEGDTAVTGTVGQLEFAFVHYDTSGPFKVVVFKNVAQQGDEPVADAYALGAEVLAWVTFGIGGIEVAGNAPVARNLLLDCQ
ncbi:MAG: hypothetical protein OXH98_16170 [Caldilineaceae bacterium]|nr:hypothetical protein [Caldilineaceae bacterium]